MSEPTLQDLEQIARANGYWHRIAPFHEQVTAIGEVMDAKIRELTQRAEAAEAKSRDVAYWHEAWKEAEAERDALRKVYEAAEDFVGSQGTQYENDQYRMLCGVLGAFNAALAVQPSTGGAHE